MQTGDGLLARLRPVGGILLADQLQRIATLAAEFGNGQIEITARGNLQVRGLRANTATSFAQAIEDIVEIETGLPIDISPLAGLDPQEIADPRPIAQAIRRGAAARGLAERLGPKVCVVIDGGGQIALRTLSADLRLTAKAEGWHLDVAGAAYGPVRRADAASTILALLEAIAEIGLDARGRDLDAGSIRSALASVQLASSARPLAPHDIRSNPLPLEGRARVGGSLNKSGVHRTENLHSRGSFPPPLPPPLKGEGNATSGGQSFVCIALAFGSADAPTLTHLARAAVRLGITEFRLAPGHGLIAMTPPAAVEGFGQSAAALGFIVAGNDARAPISACIGSAGCASGAMPARALAAELAASQPEFFDGSFELHVSGCAKGCAHPRKALLTLLGENEECRLIVNGSAGDVSGVHMAQADVTTAMVRLASLWRDNRALGESVAACFKRLGDAAVIAAIRQG
jgi:precorrin-3B synthase